MDTTVVAALVGLACLVIGFAGGAVTVVTIALKMRTTSKEN